MSIFDSFFGNSPVDDTSQFEFEALLDTAQLLEAVNSSESTPFLIFKHSTRCSISTIVLNKFKLKYEALTAIKIYQLDLIKYRSLSNEIAEVFEIEHQSPQVILVKNKKVIADASHYAINTMDIEELVASNYS